MTSSWVRIPLAFTVAAAIAVGASDVATADDDADKKQAQKLVNRAVKLYEKNKFKKALELYEQAYALYASPAIVMNMGSTLAKLGRDADAANTFEKFLRDPDRNHTHDDNVKDILKTQLGPKLGQIELSFDKPPSVDATLTIDGARFDGPLQAPIWVAPGTHEIRVESPGRDAIEVEVEVEATRTARVPIKPVDTEVTPDDPEPGLKDGPARPGGGYRIGFWGAAAVTVASAVVAGLSYSALTDAEGNKAPIEAFQNSTGVQLDVNDPCADARNITGTNDADLLQAVIDNCDKGESAATRTNIFFGVTLVGAAVTGFLLYKGYLSSPGKAEAKQPAVTVTPTVSPSVVGAELTLHF